MKRGFSRFEVLHGKAMDTEQPAESCSLGFVRIDVENVRGG
jgi:hypothetical protein